MVPVRNPQTGRIEYVPAWTQQKAHASRFESPDQIRTTPAPLQRLDNAPTNRTQPAPTPVGPADVPSRPQAGRGQTTDSPAPLKRLDKPEGRGEVIQQPSEAVSPRALQRLDRLDPVAAVERELAAVPGWEDAAPAALPQVIQKLTREGYSKADIEAAILKLADEKKTINLTTHDHAPALPEAERAQLLHDPTRLDQRGRPAYYVAASKRQP